MVIKNWCWYNDSPQTVKVYEGTENVPKKKNSWIMFHLIPDGCKILNLENKDKIAQFGEALKTFNQYCWKTNKMEGG